MKKFFSNVLATIVGLMVVGFFSIIVFFIFIGAIIGSTQDVYTLEEGTVLNLKLEGILTDRAKDPNPIYAYMGVEQVNEIGLDDIINAIKEAKTNDKIKGIYISSGIFSAPTASLLEIRNQLIDFKESKKFIIAYADQYLQGCYYLSSVADQVIINPQGNLDLHGIAVQPMFYKGLLDKVGVDMQIFKVGTYKSAVEPFMTTQMSAANKEQVTSYTGDIWASITKGISESRNIPIDKLNAITDSLPLLKNPEFLLSNNLVDTLMYETDVQKLIREKLAIEEDEKIEFATVENISTLPSKVELQDSEIAVLYAQGTIQSGNENTEISDKFVVNQIEKLRKDDNVKAVVFRVNSPGGSAYASEQIWKAITDLRDVKPVVVSMGDYAASGGYYISCNADKIIAQPSTITGSIGIFGMFPNVEGVTKKLGLTFDVVKTNKFADFGDISRPMNIDEKAALQSYIERGYDLFLTRCAEGRQMSKDSLAMVAEGRVWTGAQALKLGLVDELGGIDDAIFAAAKLADVDAYKVGSYPRKLTFIEQLLQTSQEDFAVSAIKKELGTDYLLFKTVKEIKEQDYIQARLAYDFSLK